MILDVVTEAPVWLSWSADALERASEESTLVINPLIYAEVSIGFDRIEDLDDALPTAYLQREPLPWEAGFLAGRVFLEYRRSGGKRATPLPDFYVGAHAAIRGYTLLTRDARRFRTYFPRLRLITP